jgi:hypothetical protein
MSILLMVVGAIALMAGLGTVAFGLPINEFSFGNTLIVAGTTAATGGLIVIALGAAVGQLQRIADALAGRVLARTGHATDSAAGRAEVPAEPPGAAAGVRVPFPTRPRMEPRPETKSEPRPEQSPEPPHPEPTLHEPPPERRMSPFISPPIDTNDEHPAASFAPTLRNPEQPLPAAEEEVSLPPPPTSFAPSTADFAPPARPVPPPDADEPRREPPFEPPWRSPPPGREPLASNFDNMWPAEPKPMRDEAPPMARADRTPPEPAAPVNPPASPPRSVAILKSGVVDGMGYTLYVDGSIEAELPQGTLHFASIEELRSHLDKSG